VNVALSKYYEDFVGDLIASGRYGNASEVVRAGLRALEKAEQQAALNIPDLDSKLLAGIRSPARPLTGADFDRIRTRTQRKLKGFETAQNHSQRRGDSRHCGHPSDYRGG